jgi:hypothetical protein
MAGLTGRFPRRFRGVSGVGPTVAGVGEQKNLLKEHVVSNGTTNTDGNQMPHGPLYIALYSALTVVSMIGLRQVVRDVRGTKPRER